MNSHAKLSLKPKKTFLDKLNEQVLTVHLHITPYMNRKQTDPDDPSGTVSLVFTRRLFDFQLGAL
jgi:hypothetical protein